MYHSAVDYVYDALRKDILSGVFLPGSPIVESEFAKKLGVSVTPVREALRRLEAADLVVRRRHQDIRVRTFTIQEAKSVYDMRAVLEPMAAHLAAQFITEQDAAQLQRMVEAQAQSVAGARELTVLETLNNDFHMALARVSGNQVLYDTLQRIWPMVGLLRAASWAHFHHRPEEVLEEHRKVLAPVLARDPRGSMEAAYTHAVESYQRVHRALELVLGEPGLSMTEATPVMEILDNFFEGKDATR